MGSDLERPIPIVGVFGDPYLILKKLPSKVMCLLGVWQVNASALQERLHPADQPRLAEPDGAPTLLHALVAVGEVDRDGTKVAATHLIHNGLSYAGGVYVGRHRRRDDPHLVATPWQGFSDLMPALLDVPNHLTQAVGYLRVGCAER